MLLAFGFLFFVATRNYFEGAVFLVGILYGIILIFHSVIEKTFIAGVRRPLLVFGLMVFAGGILIETSAYVSNIPKIRAGKPVYLFSPNLFSDFLIACPHYLALAATWAWVIKRYKLSSFQQAIMIGLFWAIVVDSFSHVQALLHGNVLDFIMAGLIMVAALNWPLVLMQNELSQVLPGRLNDWTKYPVAFLSQIIPMIVLVINARVIEAMGWSGR